MGYRLFIKASFIALWIAVAFWLGAGSLQAQKQTSGKNRFPGEHADEKINPRRPDKQVSDLTSSVASKLPHAVANGRKIAIRNLRRDANEHVKKLVKDKVASEDDQKRSEADIQKITDKHIAEIDQLVASKEQDIMAV